MDLSVSLMAYSARRNGGIS